MDVVEWIYTEMRSRVRAGKTGAESSEEVLALVFEFGRVDEMAKAKGPWLIQNIYADGARMERARQAREDPPSEVIPKQPESLQSPEPVAAAIGTFGERRADPAPLRTRHAIWDAMMHIGDGQYVRYGDMTRAHWAIKTQQYATAADNATSRHWAANRILERVAEGARTEDCLSAAEFMNLIPPQGF